MHGTTTNCYPSFLRVPVGFDPAEPKGSRESTCGRWRAFANLVLVHGEFLAVVVFVHDLGPDERAHASTNTNHNNAGTKIEWRITRGAWNGFDYRMKRLDNNLSLSKGAGFRLLVLLDSFLE